MDVLDVETLEGAAAVSVRPADARVPTLTVLAHPDPSCVGARSQPLGLRSVGGRVALSRTEPSFECADGAKAPLTCPFVSRTPVLLSRDRDGVRIEATEAKQGLSVDGVPVVAALDCDATRLETGVVLELGTHVVLLLHVERPWTGARAHEGDGMLGQTAALDDLREAITMAAAPLDAEGTSPVLVRGETGSGKELVAAAIHGASQRRGGPFVAVNMAAIQPSLAASELFGHARGAFSGADRARDGYFVQAHGGTLFLDEIGDAPLDVQAALLRVLETGEVQAVGARTVERVDVRVVCATDGDLESLVASERFRAPLFYRLATLELRVPPLRARRADIGLMAYRFIADGLAALGREALLRPAVTDAKPWLAASVVASLCRYDWPGNVRQLKNVCRALVASSRQPSAGDDATLARLMPTVARVGAPRPHASPPGAPPTAPAPQELPERDAVAAAKAMSSDELYQVMVAVDYRLGAAAEWLGLSRPLLNDLIDRHPRLRRAQKIEAEDIERARDEARSSGVPLWRVLEVSERGLQRRMKELGL